MPTCRPLGAGLFAVRSDLSGGRIDRVLFCLAGGFLVLLHGFIKKTQQTPASDLRIARSRQKDVQR
jgi:phage-related protein